MATVEKIRLVDDLSGGEADETVAFGVDGTRFEIDLNSANAERLRTELAPYLAVARPGDMTSARRAPARDSSTPSSRRRENGTGATGRERNRALREWARENGFAVSERGRISAEVVAAYEARSTEPLDAADRVAQSPVTSDDAAADGTPPEGHADGSTAPDTPALPPMAVQFSG